MESLCIIKSLNKNSDDSPSRRCFCLYPFTKIQAAVQEIHQRSRDTHNDQFTQHQRAVSCPKWQVARDLQHKCDQEHADGEEQDVPKHPHFVRLGEAGDQCSG